MSTKHARLGASSAYIWTECTASPNASDGKVDSGSEPARIGTACHGVSSESLIHGCEPREFLGREFLFCVHPESDSRVEDLRENIGAGLDSGELNVQHIVTISEDHVEWSTSYVNFVREQIALTGASVVLIEQRVPIDHITGEVDAGGTADVILLYGDTAHIIDGKFGRNRVSAFEVVRAATDDQPAVHRPNRQLAMYAAGVLREHGLMMDFANVRMTIVQPPLHHVSEFSMSVADLEAFTGWIGQRAEDTRSNPVFKAGDHCTYCKARAECKARDAFVLETSLEGFTDATDPQQIAHATPRTYPGNYLGAVLEKVDTIRKWCDDIEARALAATQAGTPVIGENGEPYKVVEGNKGKRTWSDVKVAEQAMLTMRLRADVMYDRSLISPTAAEKLLAKVDKKGNVVREGVLGVRQWNKLKELISRKDGNPTLAPASDPRPALTAPDAGFQDIPDPQPTTEEVDLFN